MIIIKNIFNSIVHPIKKDNPALSKEKDTHIFFLPKLSDK